MPHSCELPRGLFNNSKSKLRVRFLNYILISETNPLSTMYFKSAKVLKKEKLRHLESGYLHIIHPLSKFRRIYDKWLLFFYISVLIVKPLDACVKGVDFTETSMIFHIIVSTIVDSLTWVDIILIFFTGYYVPESRSVELRPEKIAKKYIFGPYFITDILGSLPRYCWYIFYEKPPKAFLGFVKIFCLLRAIRILSVINLLLKHFLYLRFKSKTVIFSICCIAVFTFTLHFSTCLLMSINRIVRVNFNLGEGAQKDWQLEKKVLHVLYFEYMLRSSAFLLGITLPERYFTEIKFIEEYIAATFTYIVGKILVIATWVILALNILATRSMKIKFQQVMDQLDSYMIQKQLPLSLRERLIQYYEFKFKGNYFKKNLLSFFLTDGLSIDINNALCRSLINSVPILKELTPEEVSEVVQLLIPGIFLPRDTIYQSGTMGDSMYFLSSGTVAVYTHSGKEVCHLQDGAYFGELCLVLKSQRRTSTIVAIEICHIYRMKKADFDKTLLKNKAVLRKIVFKAEMRLKEILFQEKMHKKALFEQAYSLATP